MSSPGIPLQAEFFDRCAQQRLDRHRPEGPYTNIWGDYSQIAFAGNFSVERAIADNIAVRLAAGEEVAALDVGGGGSTSWHLLAGEFEQAVRDRQLVLMTSNQRDQPLHYLRAGTAAVSKAIREGKLNQHDPAFKLMARALDAYDRFGDLVYPVEADFSAYGSLDWGEMNGKPGVDLSRKVDIIHERNAVTSWSRIPELHIMRIGALLAPGGLYAVHQQDTEIVYGVRTDAPEFAARLAGIAAAHAALGEVYDLSRVERVEAGALAGEPMRYVVFKGPDAGPVTVGLRQLAGVQ